jgi:hypothetical protein
MSEQQMDEKIRSDGGLTPTVPDASKMPYKADSVLIIAEIPEAEGHRARGDGERALSNLSTLSVVFLGFCVQRSTLTNS